MSVETQLLEDEQEVTLLEKSDRGMQAVLLSPASPMYKSDSQLPHVCTVLAQGLLCKEEQFGACVQLAVLRIDVTSPLVCLTWSTDPAASGLNNDDSFSYETD